MIKNMPRLWLSAKDHVLLKPVHLELWCGDRHGSNVNMFWIALREAVEAEDRDFFIRLVRFCLQHGIMTTGGEGNFILLVLLDVDAADWQKRLFLASAHLAGMSGRLHCDVQKLIDDEAILLQERNFDGARGGLQALLKYTRREEHAAAWKYWELTPTGALVFDVSRAEDELDLVYNADRWATERDSAAKNLHALFSRPPTPAENKWFSNTTSSYSLLVFLAVEYNNGFKKWFDRDRVWIKSDFFDVRSNDHDVLALSLFSSTWACTPSEKFSKRLLISKDRMDAKTSAECRALLQEDSLAALKDLRSSFELLAKTVTPMIDHETAAWRKQLRAVKDACAWSIVCSQTTIVGRNMAMLNSADLFFLDYRLCQTEKERQHLVDEMIEQNSTKPTTFKSNDFGPLILFQICRCVAQFPNDRRYRIVQKIIDALEAEEEHTQRVESLHQTYLAEVENGGRMGSARGAGRCGAVLCQKTFMHGSAENERRLAAMKVLEAIITSDPMLLKQRAGQQAFNSHRLFPWQCFCREMGNIYDFSEMEGTEVGQWLSDKWNDPTVTSQKRWQTFSDTARLQAKTDAEESVVRAWERRQASGSLQAGGLDEVDVYTPPRHLEHVTKYYEGIKTAVRDHWRGAKDSNTTEKAVAVWNEITNRELSSENPPLASVQLITEGPSLLTRRICWMGQKGADEDQLWKRNKTTAKSATVAGDDADDEAAETAGLSTCPKPPDEMTHLVVRMDATNHTDVVHNQQEILVVTFSWSRPFSWVGRVLQLLAGDFGTDALEPSVLAARRSAVRHLPPSLGGTGLKLDKLPAADTIRSWLWSASQPRGHTIFPAKLVVHPTTGDFFFELLDDAFVFAEHPKVVDICASRDVTVKTVKSLETREAKVVERKYVEIEKAPSLKRSSPVQREEKKTVSGMPSLKRNKKNNCGGADGLVSLVTAEDKFAAGLKSESQDKIFGGAVAQAAAAMGKMINIDACEKSTASGSEKNSWEKNGSGSLAGGLGLADFSLGAGGGSSSSSSKLPAGSAAASGSGAVEEKKVQKKKFLGAGGAGFDSFYSINQKVARLESVGGGKWISMRKRIETKSASGEINVTYKQNRLTIELTGALRQNYIKIYDRLDLAEFGKRDSIWVQECAKSKAVSFGEDIAAAFCRTWVRLVRCITDASDAFLVAGSIAKRDTKDMAADAEVAKGLVHLEDKLSSEQREKLKKTCAQFWNAKNFQTCAGFSLDKAAETEFISEENDED